MTHGQKNIKLGNIIIQFLSTSNVKQFYKETKDENLQIYQIKPRLYRADLQPSQGSLYEYTYVLQSASSVTRVKECKINDLGMKFRVYT
jgi:hypothetical protein